MSKYYRVIDKKNEHYSKTLERESSVYNGTESIGQILKTGNETTEAFLDFQIKPVEKERKMKGTFITKIVYYKTTCENCNENISVSVNNDEELFEYDEYKMVFNCPHCNTDNEEIIDSEEIESGII